MSESSLDLRCILKHPSTSPSFYLEFLGTVGVADACGTISSKVNNPFVAVPIGGLTTYEEAITAQGDRINPPLMGFGLPEVGGTFMPLKIIDVECPTWGVGTSVSTSGSNTRTFTTIGPPWLPIIVPPLNVMTLNPLWETLCTGISSLYLDHFAIFDPPHVLTPAQSMVPIPPDPPTPSPVDPPPSDPKESPPAQPGNTPKAGQPLQTGVPGGPLAGDPPVTAANPGTAAGPNKESQDGDPGKGTSAEDPKNTIALNPQGLNPASPNQPNESAGHPRPSGGASNGDDTDPGKHSNPGDAVQASNGGSAVAPVQPNIGGFIMQGFGPNSPPDTKSPAANDGAQGNPNAGQSGGDAIIPPALTIGGQAFTPNPIGFAVGGTTISAGRPAATIAGTKISLAPSGILIIGDQTYNILPTLTASTPPLTVGGVIFTPNPTGFPIASSTISPGGPSITISGTAISLDHSGILFIGDKATTLEPPLQTATPLLQAGSQIFAANPQGFTIAGTSIAPGGPAAVVSGTSISLNPSGTLTLGSRTLNLSPVPATATAISALNVGMQTFTPNPTGFIVDGKTVEPGVSGVVVDGTSVSLEAGGVLHVGGEVLTLTTVEEAGIGSAATAGAGVGQSGASVGGGNVTGMGSTQAFEGAAAGSRCCWQRILWSLFVAMTVRYQVC